MKNQTSPQCLATRHSVAALFNSFLREWPDHALRLRDGVTEISIPLSETSALILSLIRPSLVGRHEFRDSIFLETENIRRPLNFSESVQAILGRLDSLLPVTEATKRAFIARVHASECEIAGRLGDRTPTDFLRAPRTFIAAEQALLLGHPFHPTPKSRDEFTAEDSRRFSPEGGQDFGLEWYAADPAVIVESFADTFRERRWLNDLARDEGISVDARTVAFPMHPWQSRVLAENPSVRAYLLDGRLRKIGAGEKLWAATSSLRSLYRVDADCMLKFSMTLKMTNSIRHLLPREALRGLQLHDVLATPKGREFRKRHPNFRVITEPACAWLIAEDGQAIEASTVVRRENPFGAEASGNQIVLATLIQPDPWGGSSFLAHCLKETGDAFFGAYLRTVIRPLFDAHANFGCVLGAHPQNLILQLERGLPIGASFRDCQGTGYTDVGFQNFAGHVPAITRTNGNVLDAEKACQLFNYYVLVNSTLNLIAAIHAGGGPSEAMLLSELREFLASERNSGVVDPACFDYALKSEAWMSKRNFACALQNLNENTVANPFALYAPMSNPLRPPGEMKGTTDV